MTTVAATIVSIGAFLQPHMPTGTTIIRGQANNVPMPKHPLLVLTPLGMAQYTTTRQKLDDVNDQMVYDMPKRLDVQMDFYGLQGGEMANTSLTLLRSLATVGMFPDGVTPLYCSDARQFPLTTGEKQYEDRWNCTLSLQYNRPVLIAQESFNQVGEVETIAADVVNPVE